MNIDTFLVLSIALYIPARNAFGREKGDVDIRITDELLLLFVSLHPYYTYKKKEFYERGTPLS